MMIQHRRDASGCNSVAENTKQVVGNVMAIKQTKVALLNSRGGNMQARDKKNGNMFGFEALASGYIAGSCGLIIGHPLESLKVLLQTSTPTSNVQSPAYTTGTSAVAANQGATGLTCTSGKYPAASLGGTIRQTNAIQKRGTFSLALPRESSVSPQGKGECGSFIKINGHNNRGFRSLYAGIWTPLITVGLVQSVSFFLYDSLRQYLYSRDQDTLNSFQTSGGSKGNERYNKKGNYLYDDSLANVAIAGGTSCFIMSAITSPLMVLKTKQQLKTWSLREAIIHTLHQPGGGVRSLFVGYMPHSLCETIGGAIYFTTYEFLKREMTSRHSQSDLSRCSSLGLTTPERMGCAALSGMLCWSAVYPLDVLRCRIYHAKTTTVAPSTSSQVTTLQTIKELWKAGGGSPRLFYRGLSVSMARAGPVAAVVLPLYDATLERFKAMTV